MHIYTYNNQSAFSSRNQTVVVTHSCKHTGFNIKRITQKWMDSERPQNKFQN